MKEKSITIIKLLMIMIQIREHYQVIISIIVIFKLHTFFSYPVLVFKVLRLSRTLG